jgi:hypothetical protein
VVAEPVVGTELGGAETAARAACFDVIVRFFELVDSDQAAKTLDLLTPDAELSLGELRLRGERLKAAMEAREKDGIRRLHFPAEPMFRMISPEEAETETLLQLFHLTEDTSVVPPPRALTRLRDQFLRAPMAYGGSPVVK